MKLKDLLKHTQNYITVRIEECGQLVGEQKARILEENLSTDRLQQTIGLINGASDNFIKVSIIPRNR